MGSQLDEGVMMDGLRFKGCDWGVTILFNKILSSAITQDNLSYKGPYVKQTYFDKDIIIFNTRPLTYNSGPVWLMIYLYKGPHIKNDPFQ